MQSYNRLHNPNTKMQLDHNLINHGSGDVSDVSRVESVVHTAITVAAVSIFPEVVGIREPIHPARVR